MHGVRLRARRGGAGSGGAGHSGQPGGEHGLAHESDRQGGGRAAHAGDEKACLDEFREVRHGSSV